MRRLPNDATAFPSSQRSFRHRFAFAAMLRQVEVDKLAQSWRLDETLLAS
jgi:hypothetical protein